MYHEKHLQKKKKTEKKSKPKKKKRGQDVWYLIYQA